MNRTEHAVVAAGCNLNPATKRRTMLFDTLRGGEKFGTPVVAAAAVSADSISRAEGPTSFLPSLKVGYVARSEYRKFISTSEGKERRGENRGKNGPSMDGDRKQEPKFGRKVSKATERECEKRRAEEEGKSLDTFGELGEE